MVLTEGSVWLAQQREKGLEQSMKVGLGVLFSCLLLD